MGWASKLQALLKDLERPQCRIGRIQGTEPTRRGQESRGPLPLYQRFLSSLCDARPVIEVEGLVKVYGGSRGTRALDGISFAVPTGDIFGFLGPNGAGK